MSRNKSLGVLKYSTDRVEGVHLVSVLKRGYPAWISTKLTTNLECPDCKRLFSDKQTNKKSCRVMTNLSTYKSSTSVRRWVVLPGWKKAGMSKVSVCSVPRSRENLYTKTKTKTQCRHWPCSHPTSRSMLTQNDTRATQQWPAGIRGGRLGGERSRSGSTLETIKVTFWYLVSSACSNKRRKSRQALTSWTSSSWSKTTAS